MLLRNKYFSKKNLIKMNSANLRMHNHLTNNYIIGNKKALFYTMSKYYQATN
jgi:hypothetical protein